MFILLSDHTYNFKNFKLKQKNFEKIQLFKVQCHQSADSIDITYKY